MSLIPDLEAHLRDAAARRRQHARRRAIGSLATATAATVLVSLLLLIGGGDERGAGDRRAAEERRFEGPLPVGTVIPKGQGKPPRESDSTVVATGTTPFAGAWQLEASRSIRGASPAGEPRGGCLILNVLDPPAYEDGTPDPSGGSGFCARGLGFPKTPGFSRSQKNVPTLRKDRGRLFLPKEVLVYGRVPERARKVVITADRGVRIEVEPHEGPESIRGDFFVVPVKPRLGHARINWLDAAGIPGGRGIALEPPVTSS